MKSQQHNLTASGGSIADLTADHLRRFGLDSADYLTRQRPRFARRLVLLLYRNAIMEGRPPSELYKLARFLVGKHLAAVAGRGPDINFNTLTRNERMVCGWKWSVEENGKHMEAWFRRRLDELVELSKRPKEVAELAEELRRVWGVESGRRFIVDYGVDFTKGFLLLLARHHARGKAGRAHARWAVGVLNRIPDAFVPGVLYWSRPWWALDEAAEADELREEIEHLADRYDPAKYRRALRNPPPPKPASDSFDEDEGDYGYDEEDEDEDEEERPDKFDEIGWVPSGYLEFLRTLPRGSYRPG